MRRLRLPSVSAGLVATALLATGCGSSGERTIGVTGPLATTPPAGRPATVTSSSPEPIAPSRTTTSAPAAGAKMPAPAPLPATRLDASSGAATVSAKEFSFSVGTVDARAGRLRLTLRNRGTVPHELVLLRTDAAATTLPGRGGRVSEATAVGRVPLTDAGSSRSATFSLKAGKYLFVCNVVGHYASGMRGRLVVR
jgi:plastocyanin